MNYLDINKQELNNNVYLLRGDAFLCDKAKNLIIKKLNLDNLSVTEFNDENFDILNIINACNQFSFFDEKRMVIVNDKLDSLTDKEQKAFVSYINNPNTNCVLLLVDKFNSGHFAFVKNVEIIECKLTDSDLINLIKNSFENKNKQISTQDAKYLSDCCNGNVSKINLEVEKISSYLYEKTQVDRNVIDLLVSKDLEITIFEITNAIGNKNISKAISVLHEILIKGEPPIKILSLIVGQFRRMMFAKINKGSNQELAKALGCKEFAIVKAKEQASKFSARKLKEILNLLLEADYGIKNGQMTPENTLYYIINSIAQD